mmetsp:Transcript_10935/g.12491  ORF Transcript_10935/g.12491 Transcript_10935/m.12491 type:complete len:503 (-) Transcript_10935:621-2129(-)
MEAAIVSEVRDEAWSKESLTVVIFGASGDLAKKKTFPALLDLYIENVFPPSTVICGYARSKMTNEELRDQLRPFLIKKASDSTVDDFLAKCIYRSGPYDDISTELTKELSGKHISSENVENRVFYLALPPEAFLSTSSSIKKTLLSGSGYNRLIVEKPFGHDLESCLEMSKSLGAIFKEDQIYRIDHYLGKEMVQSILLLRFGNAFLEPIWNRQFVKSVVISFKEDIGTMGRGGYFDSSGIIRDVMQNHLMQVLSILAMEPPVKASGKGYSKYIRDEKVKVLRCIKPWKMENTVLGQYVSNGIDPGYSDDPTVPKGSNCPTFACVLMEIDNPRWEGVPFVIKAGKALDNKKVEVRIQLKNPPGAHQIFDGAKVPLNEIVIRLQPKEAIYIKTNVKKPGLLTQMIQSELDLTYHSRYEAHHNPDAYTRLLLDVLRGKQATFVRDDELNEAWRIVTPLLNEIENTRKEPFLYKFGSRGPKQADELLERVGFVRNRDYSWPGAKM